MKYISLKSSVIVVIGIFFLAGCSSNNYHLEHLKPADYTPSDYQKVRELAKDGDAMDIYNVGYYLETGIGVEKNEAEALSWYEKSAALGFNPAAYNLGLLYKQGRGTPKNKQKAIKYLKQAADNDHLEAQVHLADIYGDEQNYHLATKYYELAVKKGDMEGEYNLGVYYDNGYGVKKDKKRAIELFNLAARHGLKEAQYQSGVNAYAKGDYAEAIEWFSLAGEQKDANALIYLGYMYESGEGTPKNLQKAFHYYKQADSGLGHFNTAVMYEYGSGTTKDRDKAKEQYRMSAEQGLAKGQVKFAIFEIQDGEDLSASKWLIKAANQGNARAKELLLGAGDIINQRVMLDSRYESNFKADEKVTYDWWKEHYIQK